MERERIEYSSWSATLVYAEPMSDAKDDPYWYVALPGFRAKALGFDLSRKDGDDYILTSNISRDDAEKFLEIIGAALERQLRDPIPTEG